jgi:hypothetical protein
LAVASSLCRASVIATVAPLMWLLVSSLPRVMYRRPSPRASLSLSPDGFVVDDAGGRGRCSVQSCRAQVKSNGTTVVAVLGGDLRRGVCVLGLGCRCRCWY